MMHQNVGNAAGIGARLRAERERLGLNQEDFGRAGGVTRNSQAAYEREGRSPDANYLQAIGGAGADLGFILTGRRDAGAVDEEMSLLLALINALDPEDREALLRVVQTMARAVPRGRRLHDSRPAFRGEQG